MLVEFLLRLLYAGIGGLAALILVLLACRIQSIHPAVKVWACRLAMLKMPVGLFAAASIAAPAAIANYSPQPASTILTIELVGFLLTAWAIGLLVVVRHGLRAYGAAAELARWSLPSQVRIQSDMPVRESAALAEPCVIGILKPVLLIPKGAEPDPAVIRHELAHVRHGDALFGLVSWAVYALFWFVPGIGRLVAEHSLWEEVWADLEARAGLKLEPAEQAHALLAAISRTPELNAAVLGFRGEARTVARRLESMFVGRYSAVLALAAIVLALGGAIPLRPAAGESGVFVPTRAIANGADAAAPVAAPISSPTLP